MKNKHKAFTLVEVLITLGVIGVVAAITMPTLIKKYQQHVMLNRLKSTYAIINNAFERAKADNDVDINNWTMNCKNMTTCSNYFTEHYLMPYLKIAKDCNNSISGICKFKYKYLNSNEVKFCSHENRRLILSNGTMLNISYNNGSNIKNSRIQIYLFTDNKSKIYTYGKNLFMLELGGGTGENTLNKNKFLPYSYYTTITDRNFYLKNDFHSCSKTGVMCLALIMFDGWRIKDDYPW